MQKKHYAKKSRGGKRNKKKSKYPKYIAMGTPSGMPTIRRAVLRYCDQHTLTSSAGLLSSYVYRANSLFDPNFTGTGHQPMGFDQWSLLYNHYVVLGAKITVQMIVDNSTTIPAVYGIYLSDSTSTTYTDWQSYREARKGTMIPIQGNAGQTIKPCTGKFSAKKFYNVADVRDNFDRMGALTAANPNEGAYFICWYQNQTGGTDTQSFMVTIDYIVEFSEPRELSPS